MFPDKSIYVRAKKGSLVYATKACIPTFSAKEYPDEISVVEGGPYTDVDGYRAHLSFQNKQFEHVRGRCESSLPCFDLYLFSDSRCKMECVYCCRPKTGKLDYSRIDRFLGKHARLFRAVQLYGGEPIFSKELIKIIRNHTTAEIHLTTGLGLPFSELTETVEEMLEYNGGQTFYVTVSIDPPPEQAGKYTRVYPPCSDWYAELVKRVLWLANLKHVAVSTSTVISKYCFNLSRMKKDLGPGIDVRIYPVTFHENGATPEGLLEVEKHYMGIDDVSLIDPQNVFVGGSFFAQRMSVDYAGRIGLCIRPEAPPKSVFGTLENVDTSSYARVLQQAYNNNKCRRDKRCQDCAYSPLCKALPDWEVDEPNHREKGEAVLLHDHRRDLCKVRMIEAACSLKKLACLDGIDRLPLLADHRAGLLRALQNAPIMSENDFLQHAKNVWKQ